MDRRELDELLRLEAPDDPQTEAMRIAAMALRRGRLIDNRECEAAVAVIEMLEEDSSRLEQRDQLETLVAAYHARRLGAETDGETA